jgi:hypothetical protein
MLYHSEKVFPHKIVCFLVYLKRALSKYIKISKFSVCTIFENFAAFILALLTTPVGKIRGTVNGNGLKSEQHR